MFTVCDPDEEQEDAEEDGSGELVTGSALRELVLQPMESATECVAVTAGATAGAAQPGSYTVTWNRSVAERRRPLLTLPSRDWCNEHNVVT